MPRSRIRSKVDRRILVRALAVLATGVSIYLLAPSLLELFRHGRSSGSSIRSGSSRPCSSGGRQLPLRVGIAADRARDEQLVRRRHVAARVQRRRRGSCPAGAPWEPRCSAAPRPRGRAGRDDGHGSRRRRGGDDGRPARAAGRRPPHGRRRHGVAQWAPRGGVHRRRRVCPARDPGHVALVSDRPVTLVGRWLRAAAGWIGKRERLEDLPPPARPATRSAPYSSHPLPASPRRHRGGASSTSRSCACSRRSRSSPTCRSSCSPMPLRRHRPDPAHAGRPRLRRGGAGGHARARRHRRRRGRRRNLAFRLVSFWLPPPAGIGGTGSSVAATGRASPRPRARARPRPRRRPPTRRARRRSLPGVREAARPIMRVTSAKRIAWPGSLSSARRRMRPSEMPRSRAAAAPPPASPISAAATGIPTASPSRRPTAPSPTIPSPAASWRDCRSSIRPSAPFTAIAASRRRATARREPFSSASAASAV